MDRRDFLKTTTLAGSLGALPLSSALASNGEAHSTRSQGAFSNFVNALREVEAEYVSAARGLSRPQDIADGERYLMHVLETALHFWLEADPARPEFKRYVTSSRKLLGDNPDALYFFAPIRADLSYRIRGNTGGATFTSFTIEAGTSEGRQATTSVAALDDKSMAVNIDGSYEIIASVDKPKSGNWLKLSADAGQVTTRHYYETQTSIALQSEIKTALTIEPIDSELPRPVRNDEAIASRIGWVTNYLRAMTLEQRRPESLPPMAWVSKVPNQFTQPSKWVAQSGFGNLHAHYAMAPYVLMPDQALVIEGRFPTCNFANVMLWNRFMQTYDYRNRQVSLNRNQVHYEADGSFKLVVAHSDPGLPNWLDTEGRISGLIYWRYLLVEGEAQQVATKVVKLAELTT